MASIHDVAKEAGVSPATVSRSFRTPDLLSHQTRHRVLEAVSKLDYRPRRATKTRSPGASSKSFHPDGAIGFLFFAMDRDTRVPNEFYTPLLAGAQEEAARLGLHLLVETAPRLRRLNAGPKILRESAVGGILLVGAAPNDVLEGLEYSLPVVLVDNRDADIRYDSVMSDGFGGGFAATQHLIGLGHKRIAFFHDEPTAIPFMDRMHGYVAALFEAGTTPGPNMIVYQDPADEQDTRLREVLALPDRPTAFVVANDVNAFRLMTVCRDMDLRIPHDVSVIGFDDISFSVHAYPPLTTARVDIGYLGRAAVRRLYTRMQEVGAGIDPEPPLHISVPVSLVIRDSACSVANDA